MSQETFDRVQAILDGRKPSVVVRRKINPVVPLKAFIKCEACGTPITGGSPQGRGGKKYPRYWCPKSGCLAVKVSKAQLEDEFLKFLGRVRANPDTLKNFPKVAAKVWEDKQGDSEREMKKFTARLDEQEKLKFELLKMRMRDELTLEEFEQAKAALAIETYQLEEEMKAVESRLATADSFLRFAELQLVDLANVWRIAGPEQQQRVQNLLFERGLDYSPNVGILNRSNSSLFSVLEAMNSQNGLLVGPEGFEPPAKGL